MQLTTDQIDAIRKKFHPDDMPSRLLVRSIAEFLVELLAAHNAGAQEPVGVVHRPAPNGDDFSIEWLRVPEGGARLYAHPQPITDAARDVANTRLAVLEAAGNERDARLFRGLLSHCWDMRMHFDNRNMRKTVCATFKLSTKTGNAMMRDARKMIADFIENVAEIDRLDRAKGA